MQSDDGHFFRPVFCATLPSASTFFASSGGENAMETGFLISLIATIGVVILGLYSGGSAERARVSQRTWPIQTPLLARR
jgi:hypothetical protein